ncbi:cytochrome P450 [Infundibulicybe gibba]|nr:cytochrome P450 [Infundibulicybe gibba]
MTASGDNRRNPMLGRSDHCTPVPREPGPKPTDPNLNPTDALFRSRNLRRTSEASMYVIIRWKCAPTSSQGHWQFSCFLGAFYVLALASWRILFHPLSRIPGPPLAAITTFYMGYFDIVKNGGMVDQLEILHKKYGRVVRIGPSDLHFDDPEAYEVIYSTTSKFTKDPRYYDSFGDQESSWGYIDPQLAKTRKRRAILNLETVVQDAVDKLVKALLAYEKSRRAANLYMAFLSTSMEVIASYCFAQSFDSFDFQNFDHPVLVALESLGPVYCILQQLPFLSPLVMNMPQWIANIISSNSAALGRLRMHLSSQIDKFLANPSLLESTDHEIVYHHLISSKRATPSSKSLLHEAVVLIAAGSDTVGNTCTIGTFYILENKDVHQHLFEELKSVWPDRDSHITLETLEKLPYLTAVIKESLRMSHGVVTPLPRIVPNDTVIAGVHVPAGTSVAMGMTFMHNNPRVFPEPGQFRPERWLEPNARILESHLVPFSKGPRSCIGVNLAWCELYLIFANVFRKLEMEVHDTSARDLDFSAYLTPKYRGKPLRAHVQRRLV